MESKTIKKPKPRLKNLNELFGLTDEQTSQPQVATNTKQTDCVSATTLPLELIDDFATHPFRLYDGERKSDMVNSITQNGVLQPLIVRSKENGRFEMLSGHNRKYCAMEAGLREAHVIVKHGLTDDEALMYVIETNLIQRSFNDMSHTEKAMILSTQHSKLFSQGKRNDIFEELKKLEKPYDKKENSGQPLIGHRSRDIVANQCGLSKNTVARYLRIHKLIPELKQKLDADVLAFIPAVELSFLKEPEQALVDKCIESNGFKVNMEKAGLLRKYSEKGKLDEENTLLILNGKLGRSSKRRCSPALKFAPEVYNKYFKGKTASEINDIIEKSLEYYFRLLRKPRTLLRRLMRISMILITDKKCEENVYGKIIESDLY